MTELVSYVSVMPRRRPETRLVDLADAAVAVFIQRGYRRTQVADVAEALGVAKGTIYLYVASKEALFDLAIRRAAGVFDATASPALPLPTPKGTATLRFVREHLRRRATLPRLAAALAGKPKASVRTELEEVLREIYDTLAANRVGIKLIDRCAADYPELAAVWFGEGRAGARDLLARYLTEPARRRALRPMADPAVSARIALELLTFWAVHRHWDPAPQAVDPAVARAVVVGFALAGLTEEDR